jgi:hypothetical protein
MESLKITDYKAGDERHILELFEKTFGKPVSEKFWKWRFLDNPVNKVMIKLMWDEDLLVGHYAASPVNLICEGNEILTALSMTTMTHPDYAGKGIFSQLAEELYRTEFENTELTAVWGYPNNNSHYAFLKNLQWSNLEAVPTFSLNVQKIQKITSARIKQVESFTEKQVLASKQVSEGYSVKLDKSLEYLEWRYSNHPENNYQLFECEIGDFSYFVVTKVFPSFDVDEKFEVDILEFNIPNDGILISEFLSEINEFYQTYDLLKFNLWLPLNDSKHITLEKLGFVNTTPITYFGIRVLDSKITPLLDTRNWDYSMGSSDIY